MYVSQLIGNINDSPYSCVCQNLPENQCIFIRGFRVARIFSLFPKHLRAAAKPLPDMDWDNRARDYGPDVEPVMVSTVSEVRYPPWLV